MDYYIPDNVIEEKAQVECYDCVKNYNIYVEDTLHMIKPTSYPDLNNKKIFIYIPVYADIYRRFYFNYDFIVKYVHSIYLITCGMEIGEEIIDTSRKNKNQMYEYYPLFPFFLAVSTPYSHRFILLNLNSDNIPIQDLQNLKMYYECIFMKSIDCDNIINDNVIASELKNKNVENEYLSFYQSSEKYRMPRDLCDLIFSYINKDEIKYVMEDGSIASLDFYESKI